MQDIIRSLIQEIQQFEADSQAGLEAFRARFTNKKSGYK